MSEKPTTTSEDRSLSRRSNEFTRLTEELDRWFDDFGFGRWLSPRLRHSLRSRSMGSTSLWSPDVEILQRNNDLVVRADLPGLSKDDVKIDVTEDMLTIQGERKHEHEEERGGLYRSERSYGSFIRTIPLPEGAMTDQAKASFRDGVLEITMPAPPREVTAGRRLEITEGSATKK